MAEVTHTIDVFLRKPTKLSKNKTKQKIIRLRCQQGVLRTIWLSGERWVRDSYVIGTFMHSAGDADNLRKNALCRNIRRKTYPD